MLKRLLILLITPFLLCACVRDNREEIVFSSWGSITEVKILNKVISDFEKQNPNVVVKFIYIPQNYFQKLHLLFASNQAPDVIFINNLYLPLYASQLEDLSSYEDKNAYYSRSIEALSYEGKLLAIPRDVSTLVFYRNKNLIDKIPKTFEELIDTISDVKPYGISYERDVYYMFPYIITLGENIYNPQKSLKFYRSLEGQFAPKPSEVGSSTLAQMFLDGEIGLYLSGRWMYPKIKEKASFDWDVINFSGIVPLDASGWAISKESKHKDLAKKFIQYLSSAETSEYFLDSGLLVPARIDTSKKIDNKVFLESINQSVVLEIKKDYKKTVDKMNQDFFE